MLHEFCHEFTACILQWQLGVQRQHNLSGLVIPTTREH